MQHFAPAEEVRTSEPVRRLNPKKAGFTPQLLNPLDMPPFVLDQLEVVEHQAHSSKTLSQDAVRRLHFSPEASSVRELVLLGRNAAIGYYDAESLQLVEHTVESSFG